MYHFSFLDGALGYDCVRCGSRCCKGLGFGLTARELVPLLGRAPQLAPFLQLQSRGVSAFDLADGCWLLETDGRCSLEVAHGRASKPAVCRVFPLKVVRLGARRVVDVQLTACPVEPAGEIAAGAGRAVIRHDEAARELEALDADALYGEAELAPGAPDDALDREARVREAARAHLDDPDPLGAIAADQPIATLDRLRRGWRAYFGLDDAEAEALDRAVAPRFTLALGPLRFAALTAPGVPPWPRALRALPARLLAGAFLAALSARAGRPPSLRAIAEVWRSTPLVRAALAGWDSPLTLSDAAPPESTPPEVAAAFTAVRAAAPTSTLGESLARTTLPPALRPLLLRLVSDRL
ncbi:MAG TPA: hypothetical protein VFF06_09770 [Polyangia bacterium]|nr:hypothetical protein [Polyangia bacterium]